MNNLNHRLPKTINISAFSNSNPKPEIVHFLDTIDDNHIANLLVFLTASQI